MSKGQFNWGGCLQKGNEDVRSSFIIILKIQQNGLTVRTTIQTGTKVGYIDLIYKCGIYIT